MGDRRAARANRLLDPTWHKLQSALDRLYREVEMDAQVGALAITVVNADQLIVCYTVSLQDPAGEVHRDLIVDGDAVVEGFEAGRVDVTPEATR